MGHIFRGFLEGSSRWLVEDSPFFGRDFDMGQTQCVVGLSAKEDQK